MTLPLNIAKQRSMFEELGYVEGEVTVEYHAGTMPREIAMLAAEALLGHGYIVSAHISGAGSLPETLPDGRTRYTVTVRVVPEPEYLYED